MAWNYEQTSFLIKLYEQNPMLYMLKHQKYHNKTARREALQVIVEKLSNRVRPNTTVEEVKAKINNLRTQFCREFHLLRDSGGEKPRLWCFEKLLFLQNHLHPRRSVYTVESNGREITQEECSTSEPMDQVEENAGVQNTDDAVNTETQDRLGSDKPDHYPILEKEPTFSYSPRVHKPLKKIKRRGEAEFKLTASALNKIIEKAEDDEELFGRFIAGELRKFKNEIMKNRCKRELLRLLMEFQDNDDNSN